MGVIKPREFREHPNVKPRAILSKAYTSGLMYLNVQRLSERSRDLSGFRSAWLATKA
jgi:hypothetical protein